MKKISRHPDNTVLGVSMPKTLKESIKRLAEADDRNMAQWTVIQLKRIVEDLQAKEIPRIRHHSEKQPHQKKARGA